WSVTGVQTCALPISGFGLGALQQGRFRFQLLAREDVMSNEQEKINRWFKQHPWNHQTFFNRPHATRRHFLEMVGAGVTASFLAAHPAKAAEVAAAGVTTKNTAQNLIFILMAGAPSHVDTFDFKMVDGVTPASFAPETIGSMY